MNNNTDESQSGHDNRRTEGQERVDPDHTKLLLKIGLVSTIENLDFDQTEDKRGNLVL